MAAWQYRRSTWQWANCVRWAPLPPSGWTDVPTLMEQGYPDETFRMDTWFAVIAPKGVPKPIQDQLASELRKVMALPDVKESIMKMGYTAVADSTPDKLSAEYKEWAPKWKALAELSGAKIDQ